MDLLSFCLHFLRHNVPIHFMQKYFKEDLAVYFIQLRDGFGELWESFEEIIVLGIDDIDERGALLVDGLNWELTPYCRFVKVYRNMKKVQERMREGGDLRSKCR